jgi:hypothetical protein
MTAAGEAKLGRTLCIRNRIDRPAGGHVERCFVDRLASAENEGLISDPRRDRPAGVVLRTDDDDVVRGRVVELRGRAGHDLVRADISTRSSVDVHRLVHFLAERSGADDTHRPLAKLPNGANRLCRDRSLLRQRLDLEGALLHRDGAGYRGSPAPC